MTGIKKFKELDSIGRKARQASMRQRCCVCQFAQSCTLAMSDVCTVAYEKGFRRGYIQRKEEDRKDRKNDG